MSQSENDVLHCPSSGSEAEFSGFEIEDIPNKENKSPKKAKVKSVVIKPDNTSKKLSHKTKVNSQPKKSKSVPKPKASKPGKNLVDLNNLSVDDIEILRAKLGIPQSADSFMDEDPDDERVDLNNVPNMHIELEQSDDSDEDSIGVRQQSKSKDLTKKLINSLFGDEDNPSFLDEGNDWALPKIKSKIKGEAITSSLAKAVNVACTSQCDTESLSDRHHVPENCEMLNPPTVNTEVWKAMDKRARSYDRLFQDIQGLLASGMVPILKLVKILKPSFMADYG